MRLLVLNLFRKPLRTGLTVFGVAVALFLFCFLESVLEAFNVGVNMADASRLVTMHKESLSFSLPLSSQEKIKQVAGVKEVVPFVWCGGPYEEPIPGGQKREDFFAQCAVDIESYLRLYSEIKIPPEQVKDMLADRSGCILGVDVAARINKKVGDKMVIKGTIWAKPDNSPWEYTVRAIYTTESPTFDRTMMLFHYKYLDEGRAFDKGMCTIYLVGIDDPNRFQDVATAIDEKFANSPHESLTMTEKAFNMQFVSMMGNLKLLLRSIGSAVVLTMLLVAANTMMMSARERTREMGILKAIGFTDGYVFRLLIGEALLLSGVGAVLGAGLAYVLFNAAQFNPKPDFFPVFQLPTPAIASAFMIAGITGVLSGIVPAVAGMRLKATEALRNVG
jgi:putative ABC transport system permease protein